MHSSEIVEVRAVATCRYLQLFFLIKQRTAVCQSLGDTENRNKAVKNDAIVGAMMIKIGEMIAFEMPSRPSAQFSDIQIQK